MPGDQGLAVVVMAARWGSTAYRTVRSVDSALGQLSIEGHGPFHRFLLLGEPAESGAATTILWPEHWLPIPLGVTASPFLDTEAYDGCAQVAFFDEGVLCSPTWLSRAVEEHRRRPSTFEVLHPASVLTFGDLWIITEYAPSSQADLGELIDRPLWTPTAVVGADLLRHVATLHHGDDLGREDLAVHTWWWTCEALAAGAAVKIVPASLVARRSNDVSRRVAHPWAAARLLPPNRLFAGFRSVRSPSMMRSAVPRRRWRISHDKLHQLERLGRDLVVRHPSFLPAAGRSRRLLELAQRWSGGPRLTGWVGAELDQLEAYEPVLHSSGRAARAVSVDVASTSAFAAAYNDVVKMLPPETTHFLVVPWLRAGGADLEVLNYCDALLELDRHPVVVATEAGPSPWAERLPPAVVFVPLGDVVRRLPPQERARLLASVIAQSSGCRLQVVNSQLAYQCLRLFGPELRGLASIYVSVFCEDVTPAGQRTGFAVDELADVVDDVDHILADNARILREVQRLSGVPESRLHVHYQPAPTPVPSSPRSPHRELRVLWAGRLDRQKRPDLLLAVARAVEDLPIQFVAYGYEFLDPVIRAAELSGPNLAFRGPYESFEALEPQTYDVFLLTSAWEGLPNVLLEAVAAGLVVVAPSVGGIDELIVDRRTGMLVDRFDDVGAYRAALVELLTDPALREDLRRGASEAVAYRHSRRAFLEALMRTPGYVR